MLVRVSILKTVHIIGAVLMLGGVTVHVLIRLQAARAAVQAQQVLYALASGIQLTMVLSGSGLLLLTGIALWISEHFSFLTGWLLLSLLLYLAVAALDGAVLSPNLRRLRAAARSGSSPTTESGGTTVEIINWVLLVILIFLMTARPF